ncbi:MAG: hypothetical protein ACHQIG_07030 [Acidimicrobiia bacterium]
MSDSPTRAERRAQSQSRSRSRTGVVIGAALVFIAAVVVGAILLAGGGSSSSGGNGAAAPHRVANTNVTLQAGEVTADSAGAPVTVSDAQASGVIDTMSHYLQTAIVDPLRTGLPAGDLAGVFDTAALARANGVDRAALVDDGLPKVTGSLKMTAKPVAITGLGDQGGNLVAITATLDLDVRAAATGKATPLHIVRTGSFVLSPDATGAWKVSAYDMTVTRDGDGVDIPSTTAVTTR